MLNTHNAAQSESKGPEIMKAANNTMTATAVQSVVVSLRLGGVEGVWHSTSQSTPVHWVYTEPLFALFTLFVII
jgi:hypothetical protein